MPKALVQGAMLLFVTGVVAPSLSAFVPDSSVTCGPSLAEAIPDRPPGAVDASAFIAEARHLGGEAREALIFDELAAGNVPDFLRQLHPVTFKAGAVSGIETQVIVCVTSDYLALGSDQDFVRVPMGLPTAVSVARHFGFVLPTTKIVDAIYAQAEARLAPEPMTPGPRMTSTDYYSRHNGSVERQRHAEGVLLGALLAGHKKDLVLTNRLRSKPGRVAIYGWHRARDKPIQPLSTVHGADYADYSHGVRLVSVVAYVNGAERPLLDVLDDPQLAPLISKEGRISNASQLARAGDQRAALRVASFREVTAAHDG